jgi:hypothetical protein
MKTRSLVTGAAAAAMMIGSAGCMSDNSVGGGTGGAAAPGTGGLTMPAGTGGAPSAGTGGGTGTGGSGTGGTGPSGTGGIAGAGGGAGGRALAGSGGATVGGGGAGPIAAGGDSKCSGAAAVGKLCEGFEGANSMMFNLAGGATGIIDATKPYRGKMSAHMTTPTSPTASAFISEMATFAQPGTAAANNEMWGRVFVWINITGDPPISHTVFMTLEDPASTVTSAQFHLAGGSRGVLSAQIQQPSDKYKPAMVQSQANAAPGSILYPFKPVGWQCWEWHTTALNTMDFYVNGAPYTPMSVTAADKWTFPIFKRFSVGFMQYSATPAAELWVDEVAIDTARVGCDN